MLTLFIEKITIKKSFKKFLSKNIIKIYSGGKREDTKSIHMFEM